MAKEPFAAKLTSIWIGAVFFWIFKGFKGSFKELVTKKYETRNLVAGYIITLLVAIIIIYLIFIKQ